MRLVLEVEADTLAELEEVRAMFFPPIVASPAVAPTPARVAPTVPVPSVKVGIPVGTPLVRVTTKDTRPDSVRMFSMAEAEARMWLKILFPLVKQKMPWNVTFNPIPLRMYLAEHMITSGDIAFATKLGCTTSCVSTYARGDGRPTLDTLARMAVVCGLHPSAFLLDHEPYVKANGGVIA